MFLALLKVRDVRAESDAAGDRDRWRTLAQVALLLVPAAVLLERGWAHRWMTDDGFINLRVVRMILDGHGPVFNVGERVEVATSPAWIAVLTLGDLVLPLRLEWVAVVLGLACAVGGLVLATFGAARLHRLAGATGLLVPAGALVLAAVQPIWDFSTSGLEGGLTFAWLGLSGFLLAGWAGQGDRRLGLLPAAALGLGPLIRPDLLLVSGLMAVGILAAQWRSDRHRDRLVTLAAMWAVPVAYEIFRMGYYASLVPNTALAKSASRSRWGTGWAYLRDLIQPYWLVVPILALLGAILAPAVVRAWREGAWRRCVALAVLPVAGVVDGLYVVRVGGDYMHGRLLLPAFFALLVPVAAVPVPALGRVSTDDSAEEPVPAQSDRHGAVIAGAGLGVALLWAVACLGWLRYPSSPVVPDLFSSDAHQGAVRQYGAHPVTAADQGFDPADAPWFAVQPGAPVYIEGQPVVVDAPAGLRTPAYAGWGIGIAGYVLGPDAYMIDLLGLGDPVTSRFELSRPGNVGHEKPMPNPWLVARISTGPVDEGALPQPFLATPLYESPAGRLDADADVARHVLTCDELRRLGEAIGDPMTPGRFLANLVAAPRFTVLEIPPDPNEAEDRFCDGG